MADRYFLTRDDDSEIEVSKAEFVRAERQAGFRNTMGQPSEPATGGFSNSTKDSRISGRIEFVRDEEICEHPGGCDADMTEMMCPNSHRRLCVDHCGEDHTN
jgi:hypothetical protein